MTIIVTVTSNETSHIVRNIASSRFHSFVHFHFIRSSGNK